MDPKSKTFVVFDIHGAHIPLQQCLDRCGFDSSKDLLITIGDICDGWKYVYECVEILKKLKTINIIGNHDYWFRIWLERGSHPDFWNQGGKGTAMSYLRLTDREHLIERSYHNYGYSTSLTPDDIPQDHIDFFRNQIFYLKDRKKRLFIHGGFNRHETLEHQARLDPTNFWWDRDLWNQALSSSEDGPLNFKEEYSQIFIGHTETLYWTKYKSRPFNKILLPTEDASYAPMKADIVINGDTGAGSRGKLTIMDVDTLEYWQSDLVNDIYGDFKPRG